MPREVPLPSTPLDHLRAACAVHEAMAGPSALTSVTLGAEHGSVGLTAPGPVIAEPTKPARKGRKR